MEVTLTVVAGPHEGRVFRFDRHDSFLVGRSKQAQFRLPQKDPHFSRLHFLIEVNPPLCRLVEMGSTNGTCVNHQSVHDAVELCDGDRIEAGDTVLRIAITGQPQAEHSELESVDATRTLPPANPPALSTPDGSIPDAETFVPRHWPKPDERRGPSARVPVTGLSVEPANSPAAAVRPVISPRDASQSDFTDLLPPNHEELIAKQPQPISGYLLVDEIGRGGMGVVYRAICEQPRSVVALKMISPNVAGEHADYQRFIREADIHRNLIHPRIVQCLDVGETSGMLYFAMDFILGTDAKQFVKSQGPLPVAQAVDIVCQLLEALDYAHGQGYVHRDIKPSNLLLQRVTGRDRVYLTDFGLARTYQESRLSGLTMTGDIGGTTPFMPPEQITNYREAKPASDQYAAAATLYNLLTGKFVYDFPKQVARQLALILTRPPVPITQRRPDIPAALVDAITRGLAREPEDRFPDVAAFQQALRPFGRHAQFL